MRLYVEDLSVLAVSLDEMNVIFEEARVVLGAKFREERVAPFRSLWSP